jgi:Zn-finger nucleic acid-binding protein
VWACPACGGCAATLGVLRKAITADTLRRGWGQIIGHARTSLLRCPDCTNAMNVVPTEGPEVDLCRGCQLMWLDAGELEELPHRSGESLAAEAKAERLEEEMKQWQLVRDRDLRFLRRLRHTPSIGIR